MVEYTRDKILPEDLIQKTNLQQHNFMIDAINDIDGRQADIEDATNVNIDDIADLKTDVVTLGNEKLDKADIDEDIHFGPITITKDGTAVIASFDAINPTTGAVTPLSFLLPGATSTEAGVMDASSVAWITNAEARISALEGLSDVKAIVGLSATPTQAEINTAWMTAVGKVAETGDLVQDVSNAKLWVYVTDTWILYGTLVNVPLATTTSLGGIKDTALNAPGNRWYSHVEADGRLSLIGGDTLSTLVDTTVPALQSGVAGKVAKTGDTMTGKLNLNGGYEIVSATENVIIVQNTSASYDSATLKRMRCDISLDSTPKEISRVETFVSKVGELNRSTYQITLRTYDTGGAAKSHMLAIHALSDGTAYTTSKMRPSPGVDDIINKGYLDTMLTTKQDNLTFDSAPTASSTNPVTSGGVKTALDAKADLPEWTYGSGTINTDGGTCGYNYAYYVMGDVVTMRFTVGASTDDQFFVPLPVSVSSAGVQCMGISDDARFWTDYGGGTSATSITVHRTQTTIQERSFHMLVIGQPSG